MESVLKVGYDLHPHLGKNTMTGGWKVILCTILNIKPFDILIFFLEMKAILEIYSIFERRLDRFGKKKNIQK